MDKARRHELKMLKYKQRKRKQFRGRNIPDKYLFALRSHGAPCSCYACSHEKYNRAKVKASQEPLTSFTDVFVDISATKIPVIHTEEDENDILSNLYKADII